MQSNTGSGGQPLGGQLITGWHTTTGAPLKQTPQRPRPVAMQQGAPMNGLKAAPTLNHHIPQPVSHRVVIPPVPQALLSSYASRVRTGTTLLVQPISTSNPAPIGAPGPAASGNYTPVVTGGSRSTRGRGPAVNYAEGGSGDEYEEPPEKPAAPGVVDSDDSDFQASGGTRTTIRKMGRGPGSSAVLNAKMTAAASASKESAEPEKSYLGSVPPLHLLRPHYIHGIRLEHKTLESLEAQANLPSVLIPVRIEIDTDNLRIRDCFTWNLNESLITPTHFARIFCADLGLEPPYVEQVANQIRAQLEEHGAIAALELPINAEREGEILHEDDAGPGDCRVVFQIDVQIGTKHMLDHIEWDLRSPTTPEEFTSIFAADVGLSSEAIPMITHAIHEELLKHKKDVIEWGVLEGGGEWKSHAAGLGNAWGRKGKGPKRMKGIWRDWAEIVSGDYAPRIEELTAEELEKKELERERAARRLRRETSKFQGSGAVARRRR